MDRYGDRERWADHELLEAITRNDGKAFTAFYRRHLPVVLLFLMRETGDRDVSADLAAEVFAAVMLAARRYRPQRETAIPWVLGIARNTLGASKRRGRVEIRARRRLRFEPIEFHDEDLDRVQAIVDDGRGRVSELLASLPDDERRAIHARIVQERRYEDIASELQCSPLVIRKRVSRGLARLREQLEEQ